MAILQQQHAHGTLVYPSDTETLQQDLNTSNRTTCLYVGVGGDVRVLTAGGDDVTFAGVPSGSFMPVLNQALFFLATSILVLSISIQQQVHGIMSNILKMFKRLAAIYLNQQVPSIP